MFTVYSISSIKRKYIYVGLTSDLNRRLEEHSSGKNKTTQPYRPFVLIYKKICSTRREARDFEKNLKSGIGKEFLKSL